MSRKIRADVIHLLIGATDNTWARATNTGASDLAAKTPTKGRRRPGQRCTHGSLFVSEYRSKEEGALGLTKERIGR